METGNSGLRNGDSKAGRRQTVRLQKACSRMPFLAIEVELYRAGGDFSISPPTLEMTRCVVPLLSSDICRLSVCPLSSNL